MAALAIYLAGLCDYSVEGAAPLHSSTGLVTAAAIDLIDQRSDVFLDVLHDLCVMVLRRHDGMVHVGAPQTALLSLDENHRPLGAIELPSKPTKDIWALPDGKDQTPLFANGLSTLADYGYQAKIGYFVWNREQHRYRQGHSVSVALSARTQASGSRRRSSERVRRIARRCRHGAENHRRAPPS